jgi:hypothetical protein
MPYWGFAVLTTVFRLQHFLQIFKAVVMLVVILVMNHTTVSRHTPFSPPELDNVLVSISTTVFFSRIPFWRNNQNVFTVLHGTMLTH